MKQNKRAIVGLTTFSLLILVLILILVGVYYFSNTYKTQDKNLAAKAELDNSLYSLRSSLIDLTTQVNSTIIYQNKYDIDYIKIILNNSQIQGELVYDDIYIKSNISTMGLDFCSNYIISPIGKNTFYFNGSCILLK